ADELQLSGNSFTALIRMKVDAIGLWATRGFFSKGGGHDRLLFNFFSHDFGAGLRGMRVGCEIGIEGRLGLGGQVTVPIAQIGPTDWHDYLVRYDGQELVLFIDGVALDRQVVSDKLRANTEFHLAIGAGWNGNSPLDCWIDHAALWNRALSDEEIAMFSGGPRLVAQQLDRFSAWTPPASSSSIESELEAWRSLEQRWLNDPHRPKYHLMHFEAGDIMPGDPNGAIHWQGRYHLFYIFQRHQAESPRTVHCWGHASSVDLVHWVHHPTALDVGPGDPDRGIFSGNALVNREGIPTLIYHGVDAGNCMATALDDGLLRWRKSDSNPLVPIPGRDDPGFGIYDSWDPHAWLEDDDYFAIFGGNPGTGAPPALFRGPELTQLEYVGPFLPEDRWSLPGEDVSCPDFFPLGDKHVLVCISHMHGARYFIGDWKNGAFHPEQHGRMNWPGGSFFAPESLVDEQGRRIVWAWCLDNRPDLMRKENGWSGVMSLPRVLSLDERQRMRVEPVPELEQLRLGETVLEGLVPGDSTRVVDGIEGDCLEIDIEFPARLARPVALELRRSPDGSEVTRVIFDPERAELRIDFSRSSLDQAIRYRSWCLVPSPDPDEAARLVSVQTAPLELDPDEPLRLRVFLDRSMLEVFANERLAMTQRIWPTRNDSLGIAVTNEGAPFELTRFRVWEMAASNPN
ncbi:MAG: GH32 C-terminal domain-containing protein, partial [Planctomycetales bacterium]|nr:GH32 C-terminal domain-containing protein [Planctomycetales bacterium]